MVSPSPLDIRHHGWTNIKTSNNGKHHEFNNHGNIASVTQGNENQKSNQNLSVMQPNKICSEPLAPITINDTRKSNLSDGIINQSHSGKLPKNVNKASFLHPNESSSHEGNATSYIASPAAHAVSNSKNKSKKMSENLRKMSKIPLVSEATSTIPATDNRKPISKERQQGAIRKQTKVKSVIRNNKPNIPTQLESIPPQVLETSKCQVISNPDSIASGDIINDVLYISSAIWVLT